MAIAMLIILGLLITGGAIISALPLASVHVKFISPPHVYEHALTTHDGNTVVQKFFFSVGQRNTAFDNKSKGFLSSTVHVVRPENAESLWPTGVFFAPININDLGYSSQDSSFHIASDFTNGHGDSDPFLLTGKNAVYAVKYLYGRGELFFHEIPHLRALLTNQEMRRLNGLHENTLSSLRTSSPFYRQTRH